jgi:hypothetical protein
MQKKSFLVIVMSALALVVTGCASGSSGGDSGSTYVPQETQAPKVTGGFDSPLTLQDGSSYTLSSPAAFTPGHFASGQIKGQKYESFKITIQNNGKTPLDLSTLIVTGTTDAGACADIFDGDNKVNGAPQEPLAVGQSQDVNWALSCPGTSGSKFDVTLQNNGANLIQATGKLA